VVRLNPLRFSSGNDQLSPEAQKPRELVIRRQLRSPTLSRDTTTLFPDPRGIFQNRGTSAVPCAIDAAVPTAYPGGWLVAEVFRRPFLCWLRWGMTSYSAARPSVHRPTPACMYYQYMGLLTTSIPEMLSSISHAKRYSLHAKTHSLLHDIEASRCFSMLLHYYTHRQPC
jgi:hypothetical protein